MVQRGGSRAIRADDPQVATLRIELERGDVVEPRGPFAHEIHDEVHPLVDDHEPATRRVPEHEASRRAVVRERHGRERQRGHAQCILDWRQAAAIDDAGRAAPSARAPAGGAAVAVTVSGAPAVGAPAASSAVVEACARRSHPW